MNKKIFFSALLLGGIILAAAGTILAQSEEVKPWTEMTRFRGEKAMNASDSGIDREEFIAYRNEMREQHRAERLLQREERLQEAVARGCITEEEIQERIEKRSWRFSK